MHCVIAYVKVALTPDLTLEVLRYAEAHPCFPQESTVDQFFTEAQFEAYRQLGIHLARDTAATLAECLQWRKVLETVDPLVRPA